MVPDSEHDRLQYELNLDAGGLAPAMNDSNANIPKGRFQGELRDSPRDS